MTRVRSHNSYINGKLPPDRCEAIVLCCTPLTSKIIFEVCRQCRHELIWFCTRQRFALVLYCQNRITSILVVSITKSSHLKWHCTGSVGMGRSCNFHLSREMSESLMRSSVMCFLSSVALAYCFCRIQTNHRRSRSETLHFGRTLYGNGMEFGTNSFYHFQMTSRQKICAYMALSELSAVTTIVTTD